MGRKIKLQHFDSSSLSIFYIFSHKHSCHKLIITDSEYNRICCENGNGWNNIDCNGKFGLFILNFINHLYFSQGQN